MEFFRYVCQRSLPFALMSCLGMFLCVGASHAVPANPEPQTLEQPNGMQFTARQGGDEWFNWMSSDGIVIERDAEDFWCYVVKSEKETAPSKARVGMTAVPAEAVTIREFIALNADRNPVPQGARIPTTSIAAPSGPTEKILVLLVSFNDRAISTSVSSWHNMHFGTSGKTVRTYYDEVSKQAFHFVPAEETQGTYNDGVVSVHLNRNHPNTGSDTDDRNRQIVADALVAADPYVNFAAFDTNGNGSLSGSELHIVVMVAGYERAYSSSYSPNIWAHRWSLWGSVPPVVLDGKSVGGGGYTQQGELHGTHQATIGVLCHELGHDIGLPDLYDTDTSDGDSYGVGIFCLMAGGSWGNAISENSGATPTHLCAWAKAKMGFVTPVVFTSGGTQTLYQSSASNYNVIRLNTSDPKQYFLIENRQTQGFDAGMYRSFVATGGGLALWHVDEAKTNNRDETHKMVDLEEAANTNQLDDKINQGKIYHLWYAGNTPQFADTTTPSSRLYNGTSTHVSVSSFSAAGASMTCYISAGLGSLRVNIQPPAAVADGAQWRVGGGAWRDSGTSATNLPAGEHTVEFQSVAGWAAPNDLAATIYVGQETSLNTLYQQMTAVPSEIWEAY